MKTTAIIVEDDPSHARTLQKLLEKLDTGITIAGVFATVDEAYEAIHLHNPGLIFLDIELEHGSNGFELLKRFTDPPFSVIFTTQYNTTGNTIRAIRANALDFLPKPVLGEELLDALRRLDRKHAAQQISSLNRHLNAGQPEYIWLSDTKGKTIISVANIQYCESDNVYTHFHLREPVNGVSIYTESKSIKTWEAILAGTSIVRTHREYLLNLEHMGKYCKDHFVLTSGIKIPVSRSRKQEVEASLRKFRKGL